MSKELEALLEGRTPQVVRLARGAVALIREAMPDAVELVWPKQNIASYGVGPKKMSEHFCYVGLFKAHVNLGFYYGADLPDPGGLLEGTGKALRHVKLEDPDMLGNAALRKLVVAAAAHLPKLRK